MPVTSGIKKVPRNTLGFTVSDNLMITIIKGHTSTTPGFVHSALSKETSFTGEEVDICGRWDADSECYKPLIASGTSSIPLDWKHKFCHTAAQTICHVIGSIKFDEGDLDIASGLFLRRCFNCGQEIQLLPLYSLVATAFQLAQYGCEGEDLFGVIAVLLCLLSLGGKPRLKYHISLPAVFGENDPGNCSHEEVSPLELAERAPTATVEIWDSPAQTGWQLFCYALHCSNHE